MVYSKVGDADMKATIVSYAMAIFVLAFSVIFLRGGTIWAILFMLAPFAMVTVLGVWLLVRSTERDSELAEQEGRAPDRHAHA